MHEHEREIGRELRQRQRAQANGALVKPPKSEIELRKEEFANQAEIDLLEERRSSLYSQLSACVFDSDRQRISYDLEAVARSLELAFAERRRLRVARDLFENPRLRHAAV